jgi:hypothetical protein
MTAGARPLAVIDMRFECFTGSENVFLYGQANILKNYFAANEVLERRIPFDGGNNGEAEPTREVQLN